MQAAVTLWYLSMIIPRRRVEMIGYADVSLRSTVQCQQAHLMQFRGAIEYDSW